MDLTTPLEELTEGQLLEHAEQVARARRACEVQELRIAVQHAVLNSPDTLDPEISDLPGREKARRYGGVDTPRVAEFCCATLAGRLEVSPYAAAALIADALDITLRLPQLWRRVQALEVKVSYARHVARATRDLEPEQTAYVDSRVVEVADGRIPWTRFEGVVAGAVAAADPEAAAERERAHAERQFAKATRSSEAGTRGFYVRAPFHMITLLDARVAWLADVLESLGDHESVDRRRVKAMAILADPHRAVELMAAFQAWKDRPQDPAEGPVPTRTGPRPVLDWRRLLPQVTVVVHTYRPACSCDEQGTGVARVAGVGPVTEESVRAWLGPHARFTIRPVLDIEGQAPVDSYEIPDRHRRAVGLMTPADTFPFAPSAHGRHEIDHTEPFDHTQDRRGMPRIRGQSRIGNYGPMTAFHHRIKTHGAWQVRQPFPGVYVWRDPHGAVYVVDHTGTRRLAPQIPHVPRQRVADPHDQRRRPGSRRTRLAFPVLATAVAR